MYHQRIMLTMVLFVATAVCPVHADSAEQVLSAPSNATGAIADAFDSVGLSFGGGVTYVYQLNTRGGLSTHKREGRHSGSYDFELSGDLNDLLRIEDGGFYMLAEGSWSKSGGINDGSVGSVFGVNDDGAPRRALDVTELWYELGFMDGTLRLRLGKIDLTGGFECRGCPVAFDGNLFANDGTAQFLNGALVNNPTIPFPDNGIGLAVYYNPCDTWYAGFGVADAQADARETGLNTTFCDEDYFFYIAEIGITPGLDCTNGELPSAYRVGYWLDGQEKASLNSGKNTHQDWGTYVSVDQMLTKENDIPEDCQGFGVFGRFGYANKDYNDIGNFYSVGAQYQGLLEGRDCDILAFGYARGDLSGRAGYTASNETVYETYYNFAVNDTLTVSPSLQYVVNPGGDNTVSDAVVFGVRTQFSF